MEYSIQRRIKKRSALEFETIIMDKKDLVRFKDDYGRRSKPYEGKNFSEKLNENFIKFKKPVFGKDQFYKIGKVKIFLEVHKEFSKTFQTKIIRNNNLQF